MKAGAHEHILSYALELGLWYKALALEKNEVQASTRKDSGRSVSEIDENE